MPKDPRTENPQVYDIPALKAEIKKLKVKKVQLKEDKRYYDEEIFKMSEKLGGLRQELNVLKPIDETRFFTQADEKEGSRVVRKDRKLGLGGETKEDSRKKAKEAKDFQILCNTIDAKLEKQILNEEIRAALPKLEAEVAELEKKANITKKSSIKKTKLHRDGIVTLTQPVEKVKELIGEKMDERFKLKEQISIDIEGEKKEKDQLAQEVTSLRRRIAQLLDAQEGLAGNTAAYEAELAREEERIRLLSIEHRHLRQELANRVFHDGLFWQMDAFMSVAGRNGMTQSVAVGDLTPALCRWLTPELDEIDNDVLNDNVVFEELRKIHGRNRQESKDELGPGTKINFQTFLQLCRALDTDDRVEHDSK